MSEAEAVPGGRSAATVTRLIAERLLDSELAALLWVLLDSDLPLVVSGPPASGPAALSTALQALVEQDGPRNGHAERQLWLLEELSLEDVFERLAAPPAALQADQLRGLGLVLILGTQEALGSRLIAAHYVRPIERDGAGHLQRRPPALLAAWDREHDRLEHYYWAVTSELAQRVGLALPDFEARRQRRAHLLDELVNSGMLTGEPLRRAVGELARSEPH